MGEVWRARDTRLDRSVAIKVLPAEFAENTQLKLRFEREAKTISQLSHPHICTLYDVGDGYLVMELLEGESLGDRIERGPVPMQDVLKYGAQIADALEKAHRAGVVHRDLKPGNIMITKSGAKLLDFGLAKSASAVVALDGATQQKPLTQEGTLLGTFQYMAPEQLEGEEADARTDIFALGAVLYEMATGRRAFNGKTKTSLIAAIVQSEPPPISAIQPLTPPAFEHVVAKCLEKDPDERWQSVHDIAEELEWIRESDAGPAVARRVRWGAHALWTIGAIALALAAAYAARSYVVAHEPMYRFTIPMRTASYDSGRWPYVSPDGKSIFILATTAQPRRSQLYRIALDSDTAVPVAGTEGIRANSVSVTPNGKTLTFVAGGTLKQVSTAGGDPATRIENITGTQNAVNDDGDVIVGALVGPLNRFVNGRLVPWTTINVQNGEFDHGYPEFLPDGRTFLFSALRRDANARVLSHTLYAASIDSPKSSTRIADLPSRARYAKGYLFYVRDGTLVAVPFDAHRLRITGPETTIADGVNFFTRTGEASIGVGGGTIAYQDRLTQGHLIVVDSNGRNMGTIGPPTGIDANAIAISRDGSRLIVPRVDLRIGTASLWSYGLTRETANRVTDNTAWENSPVFSADGKQIYFETDRTAYPNLYVVPSSGGAPRALLAPTPYSQVPTDVTRDGRFLIYMQASPATALDIFALPLTGNDRKPVALVNSRAQELDGHVSADGRWLAFVSNESGANQVYVRPFMAEGETRQVSTRIGSRPRWSATGNRLYFFEVPHKVFAADIDAAGNPSEPRELFEVHETIRTFEPMREGDRFVLCVATDEEQSPPVHVIVNWHPQ